MKPKINNFALIGVAGYIAPRHLQAIRDTDSNLLAALDPKDSVGILDSHFPNADFFTEFERFDRHIDKLSRENLSKRVDYISICSPNYLHDSHIRFALRSGADAICEKPLVLNPWNIDGLLEAESKTDSKVHTILQLRVHPSIVALRESILNTKNKTKYEVDLTYIMARGKWYAQSWKATNIGVHFFDMLHYLFGQLQSNIVHVNTESKAAGYLEYENARVRWYLSIDIQDVPQVQLNKGQRTYRSITVNGKEIEFSGGFTDLHTRSYEEILAGRGFGLETNRTAISTVAEIRKANAIGKQGDYHHMVTNF
jgi:UDP-N-acetyl-2-amino-2-deoxyglucuronate dehydrogenase